MLLFKLCSKKHAKKKKKNETMYCRFYTFLSLRIIVNIDNCNTSIITREVYLNHKDSILINLTFFAKQMHLTRLNHNKKQKALQCYAMC